MRKNKYEEEKKQLKVTKKRAKFKHLLAVTNKTLSHFAKNKTKNKTKQNKTNWQNILANKYYSRVLYTRTVQAQEGKLGVLEDHSPIDVSQSLLRCHAGSKLFSLSYNKFVNVNKLRLRLNRLQWIGLVCYFSYCSVSFRFFLLKVTPFETVIQQSLTFSRESWSFKPTD